MKMISPNVLVSVRRTRAARSGSRGDFTFTDAARGLDLAAGDLAIPIRLSDGLHQKL
jgi:hypothetical protein